MQIFPTKSGRITHTHIDAAGTNGLAGFLGGWYPAYLSECLDAARTHRQSLSRIHSCFSEAFDPPSHSTVNVQPQVNIQTFRPRSGRPAQCLSPNSCQDSSCRHDVMFQGCLEGDTFPSCRRARPHDVGAASFDLDLYCRCKSFPPKVAASHTRI